MPTYQFEADDGRVLERDYPFGKAPTLGSVVEIDGVRCTRVVSEHLARATETVNPFVSMSLPPWEPGAKRYVTDPSDLNYGQPIFHSRREADEFDERSEGKWTYRGLPPEAEGRYRPDQKQATWDRFPVVDGSKAKPEDLAPDLDL